MDTSKPHQSHQPTTMAGIRMAAIQYVSAMTPLEMAIKEWDASYQREIEGLQAKIRLLEHQLAEKERGAVGAEGGGGGEAGGAIDGKSLAAFKESFVKGVEAGAGGPAAWECLLREKEEEIGRIRDEALRFMTEKQAGAFAAYGSRLAAGGLRLTPHASRLTPRASRLTPRASRLAACGFLRTA